MYKENVKSCPVALTLGILGGKWKLVVLHNLIRGTKRFGELETNIPEITPRMLIKVLKELEEQKIVYRKVYPTVPPKVEYSITEFGKTLLPLLKEISKWGERYLAMLNGENGETASVALCDEALETADAV
jgi:DNA-binding HxlR family transcriptional regulator